MQSRYIAENDFVSCRNNDVYDVPAYGFLYSLVVGENVCKVVDHDDAEKAGLRFCFSNVFRMFVFLFFERELGLI